MQSFAWTYGAAYRGQHGHAYQIHPDGVTLQGWLYLPNELPVAEKELKVLAHTSHMTLYSDQSKLQRAAEAATTWFERTLLSPA